MIAGFASHRFAATARQRLQETRADMALGAATVLDQVRAGSEPAGGCSAGRTGSRGDTEQIDVAPGDQDQPLQHKSNGNTRFRL
ncbi:hypothetical protein FAGKG844_570018 [Frankia sp. AgKG'84/4]